MIQRYKGASYGGFGDISTLKRWTGSTWKDVTIAKRWSGSKWIDLLPETQQQYTKTYALSKSQKYWNNGSKDSQSITSDCLIHGTYSGSLSDARRSLLWFDVGSDLAGAAIDKVELYLYRENSMHGNSGGANIKIKLHNYSSIPSTWTGSDAGAADSGTPTLKRGAGAWFTLYTNVGEKLRDGEIQGIALDADSSTAMADYCKFKRTGTYAPKLRITYTK